LQGIGCHYFSLSHVLVFSKVQVVLKSFTFAGQFVFLHKPNECAMKKNLSFLALAVLGIVCATAQPKVSPHGPRALNFERLEPDQVPGGVKTTFGTAYPQAQNIRWEKHEARGKRTYIKFVAAFLLEGSRIRARYLEDGSFLSSSRYLNPARLPENIRQAAQAKSPGFAVVRGEEITTKNGKKYYRVRSRQGASRLIQYFDENGAEVTTANMPPEVMEGEEENEN